MQRNAVRFAVVVGLVLGAMAKGIILGFGLYYLFSPTYGPIQKSASESTSTIRCA